MLSAADIAAKLNVPVPDGAFADAEAAAPEWASNALQDAWSQVMGSDAVAFARGHMAPALKGAVSELRKQALDKGSALGAVVGPAVAAAAPFLGAIGAIAYFASAVAKGAKAIENQRDIVREGKRVAIVAQAVGFKTANLHGFAGPWDGRECSKWQNPFACRNYSFWLKPPAYSPFLEITPALFPSWNPYKAPGPHQAPEAAKDSPLNDILLAAQAELLLDPWVMARTSLATLDAMSRKALATPTTSGATMRFTNGNTRKTEPGEVMLWRRCLGNVAAARVAMMREAPELLARASVREFTRSDGTRAFELDTGVAPDIVQAVSPQLAALGVGDGLGSDWSTIADAFNEPKRRMGIAWLAFGGIALLGITLATRGSR